MCPENKINNQRLTPDFLKTVPHVPGVYLMRDAANDILYIGKAKDLRKRLTSYLRHVDDSLSKTGVMVSKIAHIETIITSNEKEAFILEASLIKKHRPRYNIILRDDKNYPLIKITTQEEWPRLVMTRRRNNDGARYFGPYSSSSAMWKSLRYLSKLFPLRRCKGKKLKERERPCLNYQMKRCLAPCAGKVTKKEYLRIVNNIILVLQGRNSELLRALKKQMDKAATELKFEEAALLRDQIYALEKTIEKQIIVSQHHKDQDVFALVRKDDCAALSVLHIRKGMIVGHVGYFLANPIGEDQQLIAEAIERFYGEHREIPNELLISCMPHEAGFIQHWLSEKRETQVALRVPQKGDGLKILKMAQANAIQIFDDRAREENAWKTISVGLQKKLRLTIQPERVICLDISNIGGKQSVGAVVSYFKGEKEKKLYRHYKIRTVIGPDDYASMAEVLERHLARAEEGEFLPQLLIVDGGKGQLGMAVSVVEQLGLESRVELVGIAKEKGDEGGKLYRPGRKNPIILSYNSPLLLFAMKVRDEAHRYGITFHRNWRRKETLGSELDQIPGVGPARKAALLKEIGSIKRIRSATVDELAAVKGINDNLANEIIDFFNTNHAT